MAPKYNRWVLSEISQKHSFLQNTKKKSRSYFMVFKGNGEVPLHIGFDQNGGSAPCEIRKIRVGYVTFFRSGVKKNI